MESRRVIRVDLNKDGENFIGVFDPVVLKKVFRAWKSLRAIASAAVDPQGTTACKAVTPAALSLRATCVKINDPWLCDCRNKIIRTLSASSSLILCVQLKPQR